MKVKLSQADWKNEKMPVKTGLGSSKMPMWTRQPLVNPSLSLKANAHVQNTLKEYHPIVPAKKYAINREMLGRQVERVNRHMAQSIQYKGLAFQIHDGAGRSYATLSDTRTGQVLKTYPPQELLELASRLQDISGILKNVRI